MTREQQLRLNRDELSRYKATMDRSRTRYQITEETEQSDGSVIVRVRKQYSDRADVSEYLINRKGAAFQQLQIKNETDVPAKGHLSHFLL